jgi:hypothetical protein
LVARKFDLDQRQKPSNSNTFLAASIPFVFLDVAVIAVLLVNPSSVLWLPGLIAKG